MRAVISALALVSMSGFLHDAAVHAQENKTENTLALKNAHLYNSTRNAPSGLSNIVIRDGAIHEIIPATEAVPDGMDVKDLSGKYVLPGLIDVHAHPGTLNAYREALRSGITTMRTMGVGGYGDVTIRELVLSGKLAGPEVFAAGVYVQPRINRDAVLWEPRLAQFVEAEVWYPLALSALVNINIDRGVNWIKTRGTERAGLVETDPRKQVYAKPELETIVRTAERRGVKVAAHAHGNEGIRAAVEAGVRTIEHGTFASDETIALMAEKNVYLVPTISVTDKSPPLHPGLLIRSSHMLPEVRLTAMRAHEAGVTILPGTDSSYDISASASTNFIYNKRVGHELWEFVQIGLSPQEAIHSATEAAAEMLGIADRVGRLEEGFEADLIVVERNPLDEIRRTVDPVMVISNGQVIVDRIH